MARLLGILSLVFVLLLAGCSTESLLPAPERAGLAYFPLEVGQFAIYDVTEININLTGRDTLRYELRESVLDSFQNQSGNLSYRIQRDIDRKDGNGWQSLSMLVVQRTNSFVVVTEENVAITKLVFPLAEGITWDGNGFNSGFQQEFSASFMAEPLSVGGNVYPDVVKIVQANIPENLTGIDQRFEYYAFGVGLVAKDFTTLRYCTRNCAGQFIIEGGRILKQNLTSHGKA